jgi:hypothetical protein
MDKPTNCIRAAMATTSKSEAAVKISGVSLRAIQRRSGRTSNRPPMMMLAMTATILRASKPVAIGRNGVIRHRTQQRKQGQDGDGCHVLKQQDGKPRLTTGGGQQVAFTHHL